MTSYLTPLIIPAKSGPVTLTNTPSSVRFVSATDDHVEKVTGTIQYKGWLLTFNKDKLTVNRSPNCTGFCLLQTDTEITPIIMEETSTYGTIFETTTKNMIGPIDIFERGTERSEITHYQIGTATYVPSKIANSNGTFEFVLDSNGKFTAISHQSTADLFVRIFTKSGKEILLYVKFEIVGELLAPLEFRCIDNTSDIKTYTAVVSEEVELFVEHVSVGASYENGGVEVRCGQNAKTTNYQISVTLNSSALNPALHLGDFPLLHATLKTRHRSLFVPIPMAVNFIGQQKISRVVPTAQEFINLRSLLSVPSTDITDVKFSGTSVPLGTTYESMFTVYPNLTMSLRRFEFVSENVSCEITFASGLVAFIEFEFTVPESFEAKQLKFTLMNNMVGRIHVSKLFPVAWDKLYYTMAGVDITKDGYLMFEKTVRNAVEKFTLTATNKSVGGAAALTVGTYVLEIKFASIPIKAISKGEADIYSGPNYLALSSQPEVMWVKEDEKYEFAFCADDKLADQSVASFIVSNSCLEVDLNEYNASAVPKFRYIDVNGLLRKIEFHPIVQPGRDDIIAPSGTTIKTNLTSNDFDPSDKSHKFEYRSKGKWSSSAELVVNDCTLKLKENGDVTVTPKTSFVGKLGLPSDFEVRDAETKKKVPFSAEYRKIHTMFLYSRYISAARAGTREEGSIFHNLQQQDTLSRQIKNFFIISHFMVDNRMYSAGEKAYFPGGVLSISKNGKFVFVPSKYSKITEFPNITCHDKDEKNSLAICIQWEDKFIQSGPYCVRTSKEAKETAIDLSLPDGVTVVSYKFIDRERSTLAGEALTINDVAIRLDKTGKGIVRCSAQVFPTVAVRLKCAETSVESVTRLFVIVCSNEDTLENFAQFSGSVYLPDEKRQLKSFFIRHESDGTPVFAGRIAKIGETIIAKVTEAGLYKVWVSPSYTGSVSLCCSSGDADPLKVIPILDSAAAATAAAAAATATPIDLSAAFSPVSGSLDASTSGASAASPAAANTVIAQLDTSNIGSPRAGTRSVSITPEASFLSSPKTAGSPDESTAGDITPTLTKLARRGSIRAASHDKHKKRVPVYATGVSMSAKFAAEIDAEEICEFKETKFYDVRPELVDDVDLYTFDKVNLNLPTKFTASVQVENGRIIPGMKIRLADFHDAIMLDERLEIASDDTPIFVPLALGEIVLEFGYQWGEYIVRHVLRIDVIAEQYVRPLYESGSMFTFSSAFTLSETNANNQLRMTVGDTRTIVGTLTLKDGSMPVEIALKCVEGARTNVSIDPLRQTILSEITSRDINASTVIAGAKLVGSALLFVADIAASSQSPSDAKLTARGEAPLPAMSAALPAIESEAESPSAAEEAFVAFESISEPAAIASAAMSATTAAIASAADAAAACAPPPPLTAAVQQTVQQTVQSVIEAVTEPVVEAVTTVSDNVASAVSDAVTTVSETVATAVSDAVTAISEPVTAAVTTAVTAAVTDNLSHASADATSAAAAAAVTAELTQRLDQATGAIPAVLQLPTRARNMALPSATVQPLPIVRSQVMTANPRPSRSRAVDPVPIPPTPTPVVAPTPVVPQPQANRLREAILFASNAKAQRQRNGQTALAEARQRLVDRAAQRNIVVAPVARSIADQHISELVTETKSMLIADGRQVSNMVFGETMSAFAGVPVELPSGSHYYFAGTRIWKMSTTHLVVNTAGVYLLTVIVGNVARQHVINVNNHVDLQPGLQIVYPNQRVVQTVSRATDFVIVTNVGDSYTCSTTLSTVGSNGFTAPDGIMAIQYTDSSESGRHHLVFL